MGARGNSGVILSQIVRGAAEELASRPGELVDPVLVAAAFASAADAAYESVRDPAEGTMLTVIREMAHAVSQHLAHMDRQRLSAEAGDTEQDELLAEVLAVAAQAGQEAVERTPEQLDVLAEAGVVDAGAHGLVVILAGIVAGLRGESTRSRRSPITSLPGRRAPITSTAGFATARTSSSPGRGSTRAPSSGGSRRSATRCWSWATRRR